jgi:hypothetical protein
MRVNAIKCRDCEQQCSSPFISDPHFRMITILPYAIDNSLIVV